MLGRNFSGLFSTGEAMLFELIKQKIKIEDVVRKYTESELIDAGTDVLQLEDKTCPSCSHKDCFKIFPETNTWNCFSESVGGDSISFVAILKELSMVEAAKELAKEFDIKIPGGYSKKQEIFAIATKYYQNVLLETANKPLPCLDNLTPLQYQIKVRGHIRETIERELIGFSDGGLLQYLTSIGFQVEDIKESGLLSRSGKSDFFGKNFFIYPHLINGKISHFTLKDPTKSVAYQLANKHSLNGWLFYGQDSIKDCDEVIVVEGENDRLSVLESGWDKGCIATIGSVSREQIEFIKSNLRGKRLITIFDADDAGDGYRRKFEGISTFVKLTQLTVPKRGSDIDEFLKKENGSLDSLFKDAPVTTPPAQELSKKYDLGSTDSDSSNTQDTSDADSSVSVMGGNIVVKNNCYFKLKVDKDGSTMPITLSNFSMELRNVYVKGDARIRDVIIVRSDGFKSKPTIFDSQTKVSLKHFKEKIANAADASFYGNEIDLASIWEFVYNKSPKRIVLVPSEVGLLDIGDNVSCWVFDNTLVDPFGDLVLPDEDGIYRTDNKDGIKPEPIDINSVRRITSTRMSKAYKTPDIPWVNMDIEEDKLEDLTRDFIANLGTNLGDLGMALLMAGWAKMNAYSTLIFQEYDFVPFLFMYGRQGRGKTNLLKWLLSLYDMHDTGYHAISQMGSGVAFQRKAGYYSSLPIGVDELRDDIQTREFYALFRALYNRTGRTIGTKEAGNVRTQRIVSNFALCGQDIISDEALSTRVVAIKIPTSGRELVTSYNWMNDLLKHRAFSAIGLSWVKESMTFDQAKVITGIRDLKTSLRDTQCQERVSGNLSMVGYFAKTLSDKYFPEFDFMKYLFEYVVESSTEHTDNDLGLRFIETVEVLCSGVKDIFTNRHMKTEGKTLYVWYNGVYEVVSKETPQKTRESFSRHAVKLSLLDHSFIREVNDDNTPIRKSMGGSSQRVLAFNLDEATESVCNIAKIIHTWGH